MHADLFPEFVGNRYTLSDTMEVTFQLQLSVATCRLNFLAVRQE